MFHIWLRSFCAIYVQRRSLFLYQTLFHYMFRPRWPSSGVQFVVFLASAARCDDRPAHSRTPAPTRTLKAATNSKSNKIESNIIYTITEYTCTTLKSSNLVHHTFTEKQPHATHITKITRGNSNKRKKTALQWAAESLYTKNCTPEDGYLGRNM
jgi:hypothetical protein